MTVANGQTIVGDFATKNVTYAPGMNYRTGLAIGGLNYLLGTRPFQCSPGPNGFGPGWQLRSLRMKRCYPTCPVLLLTHFVGAATATDVEGVGAYDDGVLLKVNSDSIKLKGEKTTTTYKVSDELLTNANHPQFDWDFSSTLTESEKRLPDRNPLCEPGRGSDLLLD